MTNRASLSTLPDLDEIYKNLLNSFDPASKRLVQAGRELWRAWITVSEATRNYADALERLGGAGASCGGETREIGQCLLQISETLRELNKQEKSTIHFYETQILVPTDGNLDQDSKVLVEQRRNFEKKLKQLSERVKRDRKRGVPTVESERMFRDYQADCVKQALTEEKKRYTYMLDRHCALATWQLQFYRTAVSLYDQNVPKWKDACVNPDELSAAALAALDAAIQPYATQSSISSAASRPGIRTMSTGGESDANSNSLPHTPLVREQGVGTFHESESVRVTLDATAVVLQTQNRNGSIVDRQQNSKSLVVDPPSTGSSTLSNGSRYTPTKAAMVEPVQQLNGQKRAASVSSLVKKTDSSTQVVVVPVAAPSPPVRAAVQTANGGGNGVTVAEYAVAVKPPRQAAVRAAAAPMQPTMVPPAVTTGVTVAVVTKQSMQTPPPSVINGGDRRRVVVAMFTYNNAGSNQLVFHEGDPIMVIQDGQQGWQFGENMSTGKRGWYPASFTRSQSESPPQPRPRSHSSSGRNGGQNGHAGNNGVKHSPSGTNGDVVMGKTAPSSASKPNTRPVSMMVIQNNGPSTPPAYRPAPPPPPVGGTIGDEENEEIAVVYLEDDGVNDLHSVNYDTVPKRNPFGHVRLRHVVKTDGTPKKYG